ncbi:MAG: sugar ABC transporter permease [Pelagibacterium sp. SCN 63-23]|nr:MAG: sugar ABC transporter permease [Pelagibacterium sp. SCN 63-23]
MSRASTSGPGLAATLAPYGFVLLPVAYLFVFMFGPLVRQLWMSLTNAKLINPSQGDFVGLANYQRLFADPQFYNSLSVTLVYTVLSVVLGVSVGVVCALAIDRPFRFRPIARAILLFGWAVPNVAATLIWLWMFNDRSGVFNTITQNLGFGRFAWLSNMDLALWSVLAVTVWQVAPFVMLVVLAALQSVPEEVREAARVDGADGLNIFRNVTFPHIRPTVQLVTLLVAVWSIRRFEIIYLLTGGGPLNSTTTLVIRLRRVAFENYDLGMAGAYGAVGLTLALLVAAIHFTLDQRRNKRMAR